MVDKKMIWFGLGIAAGGHYSPRIGYKVIKEEEELPKFRWWFSAIWKYKESTVSFINMEYDLIDWICS